MTNLKQFKKKRGYWEHTANQMYYMSHRVHQSAEEFGIDTKRSIQRLEMVHKCLGIILKKYKKRQGR